MASPLDQLFEYQRAWVNDGSRFKVGCQSRQTGKSFQSAAEVVRDARIVELDKRAIDWVIAAPSERQSLELLAKCKRWVEAFEIAIADELEERLDGPQSLLKASSIQFPNGSRIIAVPGRPDTVRGYSANVLFEEFAFFEDPQATWRAMYPSITSPMNGEKKLRVISTPNGKSGPGKKFYELVRDFHLEPERGASKKVKYAVHFVSIYDAIRRGLPLTDEDVEELREGMDDELGWAQEMELDFLDSANVLLPYDLIELAEHEDATLDIDPVWWQTRKERFLGIDFGRTQDPTVCYTLERVGDILWTREILVLRKMSTEKQAEVLRHRIKAASRVGFDAAGPGTGLADLLVSEHGEWRPEAHLTGKVEKVYTNLNSWKRGAMPRMRAKFEAPTKLRIPRDTETREDLHTMRQIVSGAGNVSYSTVRTKVADGTAHGDRAIALALACGAADQGAAGLFAYESNTFWDRAAATVGAANDNLFGRRGSGSSSSGRGRTRGMF